jgi:hypothetical protein
VKTTRKNTTQAEDELKNLLQKRELILIELNKISARIKKLTGNKQVDFAEAVKMANKKQVMDTTEYLMSNPANKRHLLKSIKQLKEGKVTERELIEG